MFSTTLCKIRFSKLGALTLARLLAFSMFYSTNTDRRSASETAIEFALLSF